MKVEPLPLRGLLLITPTRHADARGWLAETWQQTAYVEAGVEVAFAQDNLVRSTRNVLRGLHAQRLIPQAKLVQVFDGCIFDVAVDIRIGSPTFGAWHGEVIDAEHGQQFYLPAGFLHGYCVLSESALVGYKMSSPYLADQQISVRWNDPTLAISWPLREEPLLSPKDASAQSFEVLAESLGETKG